MLSLKKYTDSIVMDSIIVFLGIVVTTQFFTLLFQGFYSPIGFNEHLTNIGKYLPVDSWRKTFVLFSIRYSTLFAPLFGFLMISAGVGLILLIARSFLSILVGLSFLIAWIILWPYPGMWTFEFLFPTLFALYAGLSKLGQPILTFSVSHKLALSGMFSITLIAVISILLWYVTWIAFKNANLASKIAASSAITFFIVSLLHLKLDKVLTETKIRYKTGSVKQTIAKLPWLDIIILTIGAMMVMQVFANYYSGLYEINNYNALINYYATASNSAWLKPGLTWSAEHGKFLMPLQFLFEAAVAIFLSLLILRGPILFMTVGLFSILVFAELGVSADWPPDPSNLTWEWELLVVTVVGFLVTLLEILKLKQAKNFREAILGKSLYGHLSISWRLLIAILAGLLLYAVGMVTKVFGDAYQIISISSGITFFLLLVFLAILDKYRK